MIEIKRNNQIIFSLEDYGEGSMLSCQLMDHHYVTLKFSTDEPVYFEVGDNIALEDFGYFELVKPYFPVLNDKTGGYDYTIQFDAYYYKWKNKILKYLPQNSSNETSFNLTATVTTHLQVVLDNLTALGYTYNGQAFSADVSTYNDEVFDTDKAFLVSYDSISIFDALTAICETLDCEWWVEGSVIYLGYCEMVGQTTFELDENMVKMSQSNSKSDYITRLYAFGSDRNIPNGYFSGTEVDVTVNGVGKDYLMLPDMPEDEEGFVSQNGYLQNNNVVTSAEKAVEGVAMFDDEYPKVSCSVSGVRTYEDTAEDEEGEAYTQTFYQVTSEDSFATSFAQSWIKSGLTLMIKFESGFLNGMEFECGYRIVNGINYFELVVNENYGRTLPDESLHPSVGDQFFLYNWDTTRITDTNLIDEARQSLLERAMNYYRKSMIDPSVFTCTMDGYVFFNHGVFDYHPLGEQVKLIHPMFADVDNDGNHYRNSRIIGYEIKLDIPYDAPQYLVGEKASYSRLGQLENSVSSITVNGASYKNGGGIGGTSVYVIGTNDMTPASDANVYSARRTNNTYLNKTKEDAAQKTITFLDGLNLGDASHYLTAEGIARLRDLIIKYDYGINNDGQANLSSATVDAIHDSNWNTSKRTLIGAEGFELYVDDYGKSHLWVDTLSVRLKALFAQLEIRKISYSGGTTIFSNAGSTLAKVAAISDTNGNVLAYKCYATADDGTTRTANWWKVGMMALCQTFNVKDTGNYENVSNRYYWRLCIGVGQETLTDGKLYDYVILSNIAQFGGSESIPMYADAVLADEDGTPIGWDTLMLSVVYRSTTTLATLMAEESVTTDDGGVDLTDKTFYGYDPSVENDIPAVGDVIVQAGDQIRYNSYGNCIILETSAADASPNYANGVPSIRMYHGMGAMWATDNGHNPYQWKRMTLLASPESVYVNSQNFKWLTDDGETIDPVTTIYDIQASSTTLSLHNDDTSTPTEITWDVVNMGTGASVASSHIGVLLNGTLYTGYTSLSTVLAAAGLVVSDVVSLQIQYLDEDGTAKKWMNLAVVKDGSVTPHYFVEATPTVVNLDLDSGVTLNAMYVDLDGTTSWISSGRRYGDLMLGVAELDDDGNVRFRCGRHTYRKEMSEEEVETLHHLAYEFYVLRITTPDDERIDKYAYVYEGEFEILATTDVGMYRNGEAGENGASIYIDSQSITYQEGTSGTVVPSGTWTSSIPTVSEGNYLWTKTVVTYSDNTTTTSYSVSYFGMDADASVAQYSSDGENWHSDFTTGDVYMRISSDGGTTWGDAIRIVGENGKNGDYTDYTFNISAYTTTASATTAPSDISTWEDAPVQVTSAKPYLWCKSVKHTFASDGTETIGTATYFRMSGVDGESISSADVVYIVSTSNTTEPSDSAGWNTDYSALTLVSGSYVWSATMVTYTDGTSDITGKRVIGSCQDLADVVEVYALTDTNVAPTSGWTESYTAIQGKYIWSASRVTYTDGTIEYVNVRCNGYMGRNGSDGTSVTIKGSLTSTSQLANITDAENGDGYIINGYLWVYTGTTTTDDTHISGFENVGQIQGNGIESYAIEYQVSTSGTTVPTGTWSASIPTTFTEGKFLWTRTTYTYTNGDTSVSYSVGKWGEDGDTPSISSQTFKYALSSDTTKPSDNAFSTTMPTLTRGSYLWTRTISVWSDGTQSITDAMSYISVDGENAMRIDLSNQSSSVTCDSDGNVLGTIQTSTATLYDGNDAVSGITYNFTPTNCTLAAASNTTGLITINSITTGVNIVASVVVSVTYNGRTYSATYTVSKACAGADGEAAVIYWLQPSVDAVKIDKNGYISGTTNTSLTITCKKYIQTGADSPSETTYGYLMYSVDGEANKHEYSSGVTITKSNQYVDFYLMETNESDGIILDQERVPVVADGTESVWYEIKIVTNSVEAYPDNDILYGDIEGYLIKHTGGTTSVMVNATLTISLGGTEVGTADTNSAGRFSFSGLDAEQWSDYSNSVSIEVAYGDTASVTLPMSVHGEQGVGGITLYCNPSTVVFDTDSYGAVSGTQSVTILARRGTTSVTPTINPASGATSFVESYENFTSTSAFTKTSQNVLTINTTYLSKATSVVDADGNTHQFPATNASVTINVTIDGADYKVTIPVSVNLNAYTAQTVADNKTFRQTYAAWKSAMDGTISTMQSDIEQNAEYIGMSVTSGIHNYILKGLAVDAVRSTGTFSEVTSPFGTAVQCVGEGAYFQLVIVGGETNYLDYENIDDLVGNTITIEVVAKVESGATGYFGVGPNYTYQLSLEDSNVFADLGGGWKIYSISFAASSAVWASGNYGGLNTVNGTITVFGYAIVLGSSPIPVSQLSIEGGLKRTGIDIENGLITLNGDTKIETSDGQEAAMFEDGKLKANFLDIAGSVIYNNYMYAAKAKLQETWTSNGGTADIDDEYLTFFGYDQTDGEDAESNRVIYAQGQSGVYNAVFRDTTGTQVTPSADVEGTLYIPSFTREDESITAHTFYGVWLTAADLYALFIDSQIRVGTEAHMVYYGGITPTISQSFDEGGMTAVKQRVLVDQKSVIETWQYRGIKVEDDYVLDAFGTADYSSSSIYSTSLVIYEPTQDNVGKVVTVCFRYPSRYNCICGDDQTLSFFDTSMLPITEDGGFVDDVTPRSPYQNCITFHNVRSVKFICKESATYDSSTQQYTYTYYWTVFDIIPI